VFAEAWYAFPAQRRFGRDKALAAYRKARKKATADEILAGVMRYAESDEVARGYACNPTKWLNEERWTLEPAPAGQQATNRRRGGSLVEAAFAEVRSYER
jgi:hypothetical protein